MAIIKTDPFKNLLSIQDRMNRLFEDTLFKAKGLEGELAKGAWSPPVDIYETDQSFVLKAELPGIENKDVSIEVKDNYLVIKGNRRFQRDITEENYCRAERSYGSFHRSFNLPNNIHQGNVAAKFNNGILEVTLPKEEKSESKVIKVDVTS